MASASTSLLTARAPASTEGSTPEASPGFAATRWPVVDGDASADGPRVPPEDREADSSLGEPVQLDIEAGAPQDSIARRDAAARDAAQRDAEQTIQNDPAVQEVMAQFRTARIVPGSIKPL